jgi:oxygen-independent coproporphyrinogen-3 oxidase
MARRQSRARLGLYLHIPFCESICSYCNFNRGLLDPKLKEKYVAALEREIRDAADGRAADTIFFGGGTPSLLDPPEVRRLLSACRDSYVVAADAEITIETNPETATAERLAGFLDAGVNRISFGVQSFDDAELARLERRHSAARAKDAIRTARAAGFVNLSFDLMFWLPGQSIDSWMRTINQAIALEPDHLSLYLLELYPNSPLKESMARQAVAAPAALGLGPSASPWAQSTDDDAADMYLGALARLDDAGFEQYEISNVARAGFSCRHNVKYWKGESWRGFGCGAHSTVEGARWHNIASTGDYVAAIAAGRSVTVNFQQLSPDAVLEEALFTGLRLSEGIDCGNILRRYGVEPWSRYGPVLGPHVDDGLMWRRDERFGLTRPGMLVANEILTAFV